MALYDNKLWLLSHIHNSFMSSDDTGVCEMILGAENFKDELMTVAKNQDLESFTGCISDEDDEDEPYRQRSPDIQSYNISSKFRGNKKLTQLKQELPKPKTVIWKQGPPVDQEQLEKIFPRQEGPWGQSSKVSGGGGDEPDGGGDRRSPMGDDGVSLMAQLLELGEQQEVNPWSEFGKFDAAGFPDLKFTKTVSVFCPMTQGDSAFIPLKLVVNREAKVSDLVGLICFKYTIAERLPKLTPPVEKFSLYMCEEDGSVDWDFPCLELSDPFSKYSFTQLALVERGGFDQTATCVTLNMPDGTFSQMEVQNRNITLGELMEKALERRKTLTSTKKFKFKYHMEARESPGEALDPNTTLKASQLTEFFIVRDNSKRVSGPREAGQGEVYFWDAPLFQSFNVEIITKVRTKVEIHLGISGEKVEIDPRQQTSSARFWSKQKAASYPMDNIVSCEVIEKKAKSDREVFRMVYLFEGNWKSQEFEGDSETVAEVVQKLNHLLDMRQSEARKLRKEYCENKEKKRAKAKGAMK